MSDTRFAKLDAKKSFYLNKAKELKKKLTLMKAKLQKDQQYK